MLSTAVSVATVFFSLMASDFLISAFSFFALQGTEPNWDASSGQLVAHAWVGVPCQGSKGLTAGHQGVKGTVLPQMQAAACRPLQQETSFVRSAQSAE